MGLIRLPSRAAIGLIALYQLLFSPLKIFFFGPSGSCRFYPTCSSYARESFRRHGFVLGAGLSVWRLLKCHPFHPGGFDPVPERTGLFRKNGPAKSEPGAPAAGRGPSCQECHREAHRLDRSVIAKHG